MTFRLYLNRCVVCNDNNYVKVDTETVCGTCGVVADQEILDNSCAASKSQVLVHEEERLGSRKIIVDGIGLEHINSKRVEQMITKNDRYLDDFSKICGDMRLPHHINRTAFSMFKKLRHSGCGYGKMAVFAIHQTCVESGIIYDEKRLLDITRARFGLKRPLSINRSLYRVKPVAIEMGLVKKDESKTKYLFRKFVSPKNSNNAAKTIEVFLGSEAKKIRDAEEMLNAYK